MAYRIGSFNMYKFQANRSDEEIHKDIDKIAEIIRQEKFDILALQEIFSETAMKNLLAKLGSSWKGSWDSPRSTSAQAAEGYAFIWDSKRIELAKSITVEGERTYYPRIYNQYRVDRARGQRSLIRNPYYARFHPLHTFFEIRLINIHIMYSKNRNGAENSLGDAKMRKNELDIIVKSIYGKEADKRYGNNMPAYTVILGDYNLNLKESGAQWPYVEEIIRVEEDGRVKQIRTVQEQLTTLKQPDTSEKKDLANQYANNYDHFSYDEQRFDGVSLLPGRIDTLEKYMQGDLEKHRKTISDHVPIVLQLEMRS